VPTRSFVSLALKSGAKSSQLSTSRAKISADLELNT
jgi:hypothetical protein